MVTLLGGLAGGLVATIAMTAFMVALGDDSPPPTALFLATYVGDGDPDEYATPGMLLHVAYGIAAGGVFAALVPVLGFVSVASVTVGVLWGLAYGVVLFAGAAGFWMHVVLPTDPEPEQAGGFLLFHLIYGLVLGGWLSAGVLG
ncbi:MULTISPECIES: hypothetical protein [Halolamina]|uniref:DUF1440 domain-containing protein n=1 Tax=Halolamina pelagica TaxID=699431 RepID=A0A1I5UCE5_9EURY|nr:MULTISPECIES: hypothetical protein [Halolamina]NHX37213.1 hypothetical protein [Halolamina sp. R1-12]SFP92667.1 hypothetical protein SAMN05216277_11241 [Halolamina pelagica]